MVVFLVCCKVDEMVTFATLACCTVGEMVTFATDYVLFVFLFLFSRGRELYVLTTGSIPLFRVICFKHAHATFFVAFKFSYGEDSWPRRGGVYK